MNISNHLFLPQEKIELVSSLLESTVQKDVPNLWEAPSVKSFYYPVENGEILVRHIKPANPISKRPVVFIPGWGAVPSGFQDFYNTIHERVECYYIETREKPTSRLVRSKTDMSMQQNGRDIQAFIDEIVKPRHADYVLCGTCWGSSMILRGLIDKTLTAPTIITLDPMYRLWFPRWMLRWIVPLTPATFWKLAVLPAITIIKRKMSPGRQRERSLLFIRSADIWKWRKASYAARHFNLLSEAEKIDTEVHVINGSRDEIHVPELYPEIARKIPKGRFYYMKTDQVKRERLMGLVALEFSKISKDDDIPEIFREFEKHLDR
jgi:pimeloyl-ACP methyl ester carboxylesterase